MAARQVHALLMGEQACVFYGAAEFSRDTDIAVLAEPDNLERLQAALMDLRAGCIAVPPFELDFLRRGHALHLRCHHPEAAEMRVDVMSVMRGLAPFPELLERRTVLADTDGTAYQLLSMPDLVAAKKLSVTRTGQCCAACWRQTISPNTKPSVRRACASGWRNCARRNCWSNCW